MSDKVYKFSQKKKDIDETELENVYLRAFKTGETKVRFLEEPGEWDRYSEHFTRDRRAFPCTQNTNSCPGCTHEDEQIQRRSRKYGTFVYLPESNITLPVKVPVTLANRLTARAERNQGTLINRDYIIIRTGEGLNTEYDVDQDEKYPLDTKALLGKTTMSIPQILQRMFEDVWGDPEEFKPQSDSYTPAKLSQVPGRKARYEPSGLDVFAKQREEDQS